jgi:hypothetical protein
MSLYRLSDFLVLKTGEVVNEQVTRDDHVVPGKDWKQRNKGRE